MEQSGKRTLFRLKSFAIFLLNTSSLYVDDLACTYKHKSSWVKRKVFQDWKTKKKKERTRGTNVSF